MNSILLWISVFGVCIVFLYLFLFLRFTYRILVDHRLPMYMHVKLDENQLRHYMNKIK